MKRVINYLKNIGKDPSEVRMHPKYNIAITYEHTIDGVHYYRLANDYEMFEKRYRFLRTFYQQLELKFTSETLSQFMDSIIAEAEKGKLSKVFDIAKEVKYRSEWLFEPESLYRLYSVVCFDLQENIEDYDIEYNKQKIDAFKKKSLLKHILQLLVGGSKTLLNLSDEDFQAYMLQLNQSLERQSKLISQD